jgi:hypothetical protein
VLQAGDIPYEGNRIMSNIKGLKIAALIPLGGATAVLLLFALGETAGGDWSGLGHLIFAVPIGLLMWLGWKRPSWAGLLLLLLGLLAAIVFSDALRGPGWLGPLLIIIGPLLLSALLLLGAAALERRAA